MKLSLNLASRSYVNERALKWGYLLFALLLLLIFLFQLTTYLQSRQLMLGYQANIKSLEQQLSGAVPEHFTAGQLAVQQQAISRAEALLQKDAFRWTALFDRLETLLPRDVSIRSFSPNYKDDSLILTGVAKKLTDLQQLLNNLHADSFQQVFLQSQGQVEVIGSDESKKTAHQFTIRLEGVF